MDDKKHPERFTIAFNLNDERQRAASEELRRHGRRKALFLTDAILSYVRGQSPQADSAQVEEIVKRCVDSVLQSMCANPPTQEPINAAPVIEAPAPTSLSEEWSKEDMSVIADTLLAFQT